MVTPSHPRPATWTRPVIAQLVAVALVLVAGVVSAGALQRDDEEQVLSVAAVNASAVAQKTYRTTFTMELDGSGLHVESTGETVIDVERKLASGSFQVPGGGRMEFRQVGDQSYFTMPSGSLAPGGKRWVSLASPGSADAVPGMGFGTQDPLKFLEMLAGSDSVEPEGEETVNGTRTTHYSVPFDGDRITAMADGSTTMSLPPGAAGQLRDGQVDLWVDDQDVPRRMRMTMDIGQMSMRVTFEFLDYGEPVEVTAPPAAEVHVLTDRRQLGQLHTGGFG